MFEGGQGGNVNLDKMDEAQTYFTYCLMKLQGPAKSFSPPPFSFVSKKCLPPRSRTTTPALCKSVGCSVVSKSLQPHGL